MHCTDCEAFLLPRAGRGSVAPRALPLDREHLQEELSFVLCLLLGVPGAEVEMAVEVLNGLLEGLRKTASATDERG